MLQVSSGTNDTLKALKHAQESLRTESVKISRANSSNPGIPPSSLMAFLKKVCSLHVHIPLFSLPQKINAPLANFTQIYAIYVRFD